MDVPPSSDGVRVWVGVHEIDGRKVWIAFEAPRAVLIYREELLPLDDREAGSS